MKQTDKNTWVAALIILIGALPFFFFTPAYAGEEDVFLPGMNEEVPAPMESENKTNRWLDDYSEPVGFTYGAYAKLQTAYLWRGLYCGGMNIQGSAKAGYGGLYASMWWNIGVTDWSFKEFQPEVDLSIGFNRWGLNVNVLYVHHFDRPFFDLHTYPDYGNSLELRVSYTVSSKLPLCIFWGTKVAGTDGMIPPGRTDTVKAWSSYLEISYTHKFPYDISLYGAVGVTPWKSRYTFYEGHFAVQNIELCLRKEWSVSKHCGIMLEGTFCLNPWLLAAYPRSARWEPLTPGEQSINANIGAGVFLK